MNPDTLGELRSRLSMTDIEVKITNPASASQNNYSSNISRSPVNISNSTSGLQSNPNIPSPSSPLSSLSSASSTSSPPTASANVGLRIIKEASLNSEINQATSSKVSKLDNNSASKKSRKSKTPIACRGQLRKISTSKSSHLAKDISTISSVGTNFNISSIHLKDRGMDMIAEKTTNSSTFPTGPSNMSNSADTNGLPLPPPNPGIKSYSDFMRNLAAKYNNNDYNTPPRNPLDTPFPPFKTGTTPLLPNNQSQSSQSNPPSNPLLGNFQSPFPFPLGHSGLGNLGITAANLAAAAAAAAGNKQLLDEKPNESGKPSLSPMGSIPGLSGLSMQSMMELTSTHQALLSLARSAAASNLSTSIPTSNPSNQATLSSAELTDNLKSSIEQPKKRNSSGTLRTTAECPLDLSGPQTIPAKKPRLSSDGENLGNDNKGSIRLESERQLTSGSTMTNGGVPSLLSMQLNVKQSNQIQVDPTMLNWNVDEVVDFVSSIDICKEYSEIFRDHNIDGSSLPLLTEDHLTLRLGMKLGPALKLKSIISKKLGAAHAEICVHCSHCQASSKPNQGNNSLMGSQRAPTFTPSNSYNDQKQNTLIQKSDMNVGGQHSSPSNPNLSTLMSEDRRSPSESSNVSTGNTPMTDIKEEPCGRSSSRNSNSVENKNESS